MKRHDLIWFEQPETESVVYKFNPNLLTHVREKQPYWRMCTWQYLGLFIMLSACSRQDLVRAAFNPCMPPCQHFQGCSLSEQWRVWGWIGLRHSLSPTPCYCVASWRCRKHCVFVSWPRSLLSAHLHSPHSLTWDSTPRRNIGATNCWHRTAASSFVVEGGFCLLACPFSERAARSRLAQEGTTSTLCVLSDSKHKKKTSMHASHCLTINNNLDTVHPVLMIERWSEGNSTCHRILSDIRGVINDKLGQNHWRNSPRSTTTINMHLGFALLTSWETSKHNMQQHNPAFCFSSMTFGNFCFCVHQQTPHW